jgi:hypothetical protein
MSEDPFANALDFRDERQMIPADGSIPLISDVPVVTCGNPTGKNQYTDCREQGGSVI